MSAPLVCCVSIILMAATVARASICVNRLDIVIAVDTTSSETSTSFDAVKAEVKGIVSGFAVGPKMIRLALISMSGQAQVVVNFDGVSSLSDFNAAIDGLTFSTDNVDLAGGMKLAKDSVLRPDTNTINVTNPNQTTSRVLILVKDRRPLNAAVSNANALSRMTSESAALKTLGVAIHAVGVQGLWNRLELEALFGLEYLLIKNKNKALESAKSLNKMVCELNCPRKGTTTLKNGRCINFLMHRISTRVSLAEGSSVCRTEIEREFVNCTDTAATDCRKVDRKLGTCGLDNRTTIESSWEYFDKRNQSCETKKSVSTVDCADMLNCPGQKADVIFLLDKASLKQTEDFEQIKMATIAFVTAFNVGPDTVLVGVYKFGFRAEDIIQLASVLDKSSLLTRLNKMSTDIVYNIPTIH